MRVIHSKTKRIIHTTPGNQNPRTILAYKQTFAALPREQTTRLQNGTQAHMDIWPCTMGMHSNLKSRHNLTLPSEDPPENRKCPMVCN